MTDRRTLRDPARLTDSPAFYKERIRLLEAENKKLRAALRVIFFEGGRINAVAVAEAALDDEAGS